jgi:hypothetical protein
MKNCRDCYAPAGADGYRCDAHAAEWKRLGDEYVSARHASGGEGWTHADCDHANQYCTETLNNVYVVVAS